jgi:hypothetical protein
LEVVKYLIEHGANINADNDAALRFSAQNGHLEIVKYLIEHGANIHSVNDHALRFSAQKGHLEIVKYLIEHGANIHDKNDHALRLSAQKGHLEIVKYLIEHGADINVIKNNTTLDKVIKDYIKTRNISLYKNYKSKCDSLLLTDTQLRLINKKFKSKFTKDNICEKLNKLFKKNEEFKNLMIPKCHNDTTILLTEVKDVPGIFFYNKEINNKLFCGDIRELSKISNNKNPWTNEKFTKELQEIQKDIDKYKLIIDDIDDIDEEEPYILEAIEITIRKAISNVLEFLRYPKDAMLYVNADKNKTIEFLNKLEFENIISLNDKQRIKSISDLNGLKLGLANLLKIKLENDNMVMVNGVNISSISVMLEETYNNVY